MFGQGRKLESCFRDLDTKMKESYSPENCIVPGTSERPTSLCGNGRGEHSPLARAILDLAAQLFLCQVFGHLLDIGTKRSS